MKRILSVFVLLAIPAISLISCEKYEDGRPAKSVRAVFSEMYPGAREVEWESDLSYWNVSFELGTPPAVKDCDAWYDVNAKWIRTETEISSRELPQSVKDAIAVSEYAGAVLDADDVKFVETPDGAFYQLEVQYKGLEIRLDITEEGNISLAGMDF